MPASLGPSLTVPFADGVMTLGRYQEIVFVDFDARPTIPERGRADHGRMSAAADRQDAAPGCAPGERTILQVALDFVDLPRAITVATEAVAGGVDWIEAGTPLIKSEGLRAVRELKAAFPDHTILADMKTMDAGRTEVEYAAKAGAQVVGVLGAASDATIKECAEAARNYGCRLIVDMIEVADPVERARRAEELGADYIGIHTAIDRQMRGEEPFEHTAGRGGIRLSPGLRRRRHQLGDGCRRRPGRRRHRRRRRRHHQGRRRGRGGGRDPPRRSTRTSASRRPSSNAPARRPCAPSWNRSPRPTSPTRGTGSQACRASRPLLPGAHMCGPAVTVRTYPGDWAKPVEAIDVCKAGDVLVIDAADSAPAIWGELATHSAIVKGLAGLVVWGAIRDTPEIARLRFPAFSSLVSSNAGEPKGFGEINVPITIAGQIVHPGDWVVGDDDGVMVLPRAQAVELANRAMDVLERENRLRGEIEAGKTLSEVAYLQKWEKAR